MFKDRGYSGYEVFKTYEDFKKEIFPKQYQREKEEAISLTPKEFGKSLSKKILDEIAIVIEDHFKLKKIKKKISDFFSSL